MDAFSDRPARRRTSAATRASGELPPSYWKSSIYNSWLDAIRTLDRQHVTRLKALHDAFEERWAPGDRLAVAGHRKELRELVDGCAAVTGGFMYRGILSPNSFGHYLFSDFCSTELSSLVQAESGEWEPQTLLIDSPITISTFGEGHDGEIYVGAVSFDSTTYPIYHIRELSVVSQTYIPMLTVTQ